jgi:hypothetical protein
MSNQSKLSRGRHFLISAAAHAAAPIGNTPPDYSMAPVTSTGLVTTGLLIILSAPVTTPAVAGAGGFAVTVWIQNPITTLWGSFATVNINYGEAWVTYDIDAASLYFQIGNVASGDSIYIDALEQ